MQIYLLIQGPEFYQSQLFKRHHHPGSETKFALYVSATDSKGHNKFYYLKPESGTIVAEESSSPDGYYYFSMSKAYHLDVRTPHVLTV